MKFSYLLLMYLGPVLVLEAQQDFILIGKSDSVYSSILDENRKFWIHVPYLEDRELYEQQKFPVIFLLDGEADNFAYTKSLIDHLSLNNTVCPQMIVVGIQNTNRLRDFTPTHVEVQPGSGGGDKFISFLKEELLPFIDSTYPTAPYRMLVGHSLSGLGVMNAFINHRDLFNSYLAIDPSLWWDNQLVLKQTKDSLNAENKSEVSFYLAIANSMEKEIQIDEVFSDTTYSSLLIRSNLKLVEYLTQKAEKTYLNVNWKYYPDDDHMSVVPIAIYDGLRQNFKNYDLKLKESYFYDPSFDIASLLQLQYTNASLLMGYTIKPPGDVVNGLANFMMILNQFEKAESLFKLNVTNYPKTGKVYQDLGNYYLSIDKKELADESFSKATSSKINSSISK